MGVAPPLVGEAVNVTFVPTQMLFPGFAETLTLALTDGVMVRSAPLSEPVTTGLELTTRILYAVPKRVACGMVAEIVPAVVVVSVPIFTGLAKLPAEFESCAVKIFPELAVPVVPETQ